MAWQKSPDALVATFHETLAAFPDARVRKMFGYPCAFVGGHMTTGLFEASWFVRTSDDDRDELLALEGAAPFSPMPGRPMTGYVVLPASVVEDAGTRRAWVEGAIAASRALPPKA